jgi:hypothetical protein
MPSVVASSCRISRSCSRPVRRISIWALGLAADAIRVDQNNDYDANEQAINGDENIKRTFQAEWSFNLGIKGFAWDKTNGSKSPNDAALATATNWDKYSTSNKDIAGVMVKHN